MNYILRAVIHEDQWKRQLDDIVWVCHEAGIEEVYLKEQCHQILMSPFPMEKHRRMAEIYGKMAERLREERITYSINLATSVGHVDCRLKDKDLLPYGKFTGESLQPADSVYCILDEGWQNYIASVCAVYASTHPAVLMVDDDFRSLNHSAAFGCFCPIHAKAVSEKLGRELDSGQLLAAVTRNSEEGRSVRRAWLEVNFEGQKKAAAGIEQAVHRVDPAIRIGLMNSGEAAHALQGRDMETLLRTFAGANRPLSRPLGGAYSDCLHQDLVAVHQGMALSMAQLSPEVEIISEVENWPHTRFTKSLNMTGLQMELHTLAGADKISLNVFDFMATPYIQEKPMVELIRDRKQELDKAAELRRGKAQDGLGLLWYPGQENLLETPGGRLEELIIKREFDTLFPMIGIPVCFQEREVNLLSGVNALCCSREELIRLLGKGLILDGDAARYVCRRGLGSYIGCDDVGDELNSPSAELLCGKEFHGTFAGNLLPTDWLRLEYKKIRIPLLQYDSACRVLTKFVDKDKNVLGNGITLYENRLGGRVCVIPGYIGTWQFAYRSRSWQMMRIVDWLSKGEFPVLVEDSPNIAPLYYLDRKTGEGLLALVNTGLDKQRVCFRCGPKLCICEDDMEEVYRLEPLELRMLRTCIK
ncbi:hypothetical protein [Hungatella sp.]|uniref:hypothetical protein n=1 Tax=Hungatella sp. TaxID=2613924 RepID=UPI002A838D7C|nr:hypothetical protein [Hungatella sp.]